MAKVPTEEELQRMTPDERIKRLRELSEEKKKELEATRKQVEEELAAAEALISRSEEAKEEEEQAIDEAVERVRELQREESLEERLASERTGQQPAEEAKQYTQPSGLYRALPDAIEELERLYGQRNWSQEDVRNYNQAKEQVQRAQQYTLTSEILAEELGLGMSVLNRMKYRT